MGNGIIAANNGTVNLLGTEFTLNGVSLNNLVLNEPRTVLDRNVRLSGVLADGTAFSFDLNSSFAPSQDNFQTGAVLNVILTESEVLLGDVNLDGVVNFLDIAGFVTILLAGAVLDEADINQDGIVNFLDIGPFVVILLSS